MKRFRIRSTKRLAHDNWPVGVVFVTTTFALYGAARLLLWLIDRLP